MQVLDHGKNARIGPVLKTFLGFLDGSHMILPFKLPFIEVFLAWHA